MRSIKTLRKPDATVKQWRISKQIFLAKASNASRFARLLALTAQAIAVHSFAGYNSLVTTPSQTARVKVLFFGRLKEIVGQAEDFVELPDGAPIEALFTHYGANHPELARFRASLVASRNQEFAAWSTPLHSGDEVAFLPPVSGG
ncbi:MAG: MoaD/ThiS family protein [Candidatus Acidiferrum sp.]